jgi:hypothetical protein
VTTGEDHLALELILGEQLCLVRWALVQFVVVLIGRVAVVVGAGGRVVDENIVLRRRVRACA